MEPLETVKKQFHDAKTAYFQLYEKQIKFTRCTDESHPLSSEPLCKLHTKEKIDKYTHLYDPTPYLAQLRDMKIDEDILQRFDSSTNTKCCKVISISLYFPECKIENMEKYIYSIYRTVKNVEKNLNDWIVRLYFDISVYNCILNRVDKTTETKHDITTEPTHDIKSIFDYIIISENVEIYTYVCGGADIPLSKTRILRFMALSDPNVALCVVREADGYVSNLDCHNIKLYDRCTTTLFYLPQLFFMSSRVKEYYEHKFYERYNTYSLWLKLYILEFEKKFFTSNIHIYDLLAGLFSIKLRLKRDYYLQHVKTLNTRIDDYIANFDNRKQSMTICTIQDDSENHKKYENNADWCECNLALHRFNNAESLQHILNIGFDEILLLDMFKEIISIPEPDIKNNQPLLQQKFNLFYQHPIKHILLSNIKDIKTMVNEHNIIYITPKLIIELLGLITELIVYKLNEHRIVNITPEQKIELLKKISESGLEMKYINISCIIDSLLKNIIINIPFEICYDVKLIFEENFEDNTVHYDGRRLTELQNEPYNLLYDRFYD